MVIFDANGDSITEFPEVSGKRVMPVDIKQSTLPDGGATSANQQYRVHLQSLICDDSLVVSQRPYSRGH